MPKKNLIITVVLVIVVVGAGAFWWLRSDNKTTPSSTATDTSALGTTSSEPAAATITYSDSGFSPSTTTVTSGQTVAIKNTSSHSMQFDSDPHPIHTNDPELNVGEVTPGETLTFKVQTTGSFGYHNHLNPAQKGTIVVE